MRIATWNIGSCFVKGASGKYDVLDVSYFIEELKKIQPDVVCLQEVSIRSQNDHQASEIAQGLGMDYVAVHKLSENHVLKGEDNGVAILSRHQILNSETHLFPNPKLELTGSDGSLWVSFDKGSLRCELEIDERSASVIAAHGLPFWRFERLATDSDFEHIAQDIEDTFLSSAMPVLVGMDANFSNTPSLIPRVYEAGFKDAFIGVTVPDDVAVSKKKHVPEAHSDHIFYSADWTVKDAGVISGNADHFLCWADLELQHV